MADSFRGAILVRGRNNGVGSDLGQVIASGEIGHLLREGAARRQGGGGPEVDASR